MTGHRRPFWMAGREYNARYSRRVDRGQCDARAAAVAIAKETRYGLRPVSAPERGTAPGRFLPTTKLDVPAAASSPVGGGVGVILPSAPTVSLTPISPVGTSGDRRMLSTEEFSDPTESAIQIVRKAVTFHRHRGHKVLASIAAAAEELGLGRQHTKELYYRDPRLLECWGKHLAIRTTILQAEGESLVRERVELSAQHATRRWQGSSRTNALNGHSDDTEPP